MRMAAKIDSFKKYQILIIIFSRLQHVRPVCRFDVLFGRSAQRCAAISNLYVARGVFLAWEYFSTMWVPFNRDILFSYSSNVFT